MTKWDNPKTENLLKAVLSLQTMDEEKRFFRDLLTPQELNEFANRWQAAQMLNKRLPYALIEKETGMSSTTIARVSKWLTRGMNGYQAALAKLNNNHHDSSASFGKELC